jgi:hypothetical protein
MTKRFSIVAISTALLACAFLQCDNSTGSRERLRWRTVLDIPLNHTWEIGYDLNSVEVAEGTVMDLGTDTILMRSDIIEMLRKLTDHETDYQLSVTNNTGRRFTLFGALYRKGDAAGNLDIYEFYNLITAPGDPGVPGASHINLLGRDGIDTRPGETGTGFMPSGTSDRFCDIILNSESIVWRWLALLGERNVGSLSDTCAVDTRLRIRISGVNSFDSLFTL